MNERNKTADGFDKKELDPMGVFSQQQLEDFYLKANEEIDDAFEISCADGL